MITIAVHGRGRRAPGLMKRLQSCVPRGTRLMTYSAPMMASAYARGVRASVDTATAPPGRASCASARINAGASLTCSITSEATTASYCAPAQRQAADVQGNYLITINFELQGPHHVVLCAARHKHLPLIA